MALVGIVTISHPEARKGRLNGFFWYYSPKCPQFRRSHSPHADVLRVVATAMGVKELVKNLLPSERPFPPGPVSDKKPRDHPLRLAIAPGVDSPWSSA
ncbi:hypothetical protein ZHAS_00017592 [Anopheles sinensis]|uniref:Uncharacterized protein n=1 Tax=Anopheles sinensis TaxID=74873 RepID=A0A084WH86_ANOSI|nr:hypothetical protein ZHAS_00017592 [Anopheles sinensis]